MKGRPYVESERRVNSADLTVSDIRATREHIRWELRATTSHRLHTRRHIRRSYWLHLHTSLWSYLLLLSRKLLLIRQLLLLSHLRLNLRIYLSLALCLCLCLNLRVVSRLFR